MNRKKFNVPIKLKGTEQISKISEKLFEAAKKLDEVNSILSEVTSRNIELILEIDS